MDEATMLPQPGQVWAHWKTQHRYEIISIVRSELNGKALSVVYRACGSPEFILPWVRPLEDFMSYNTDGTQRFEPEKVKQDA